MTMEKIHQPNYFNEIPPLDFHGMDMDQLPEVKVEEDDFIDADPGRSTEFFTTGALFKPQTTRNVKHNSFADNQVMKS